MRFDERLHRQWAQTFKVGKVLYQEQTEHQELVIFECEGFGRVLALDGVIQLTEGDEYMYHEMMAHVPILAHGHARHVCVVGGGDGGVLREVLKHPGIESATLVEIDAGVVAFSKTYLPSVSDGAFDDARVKVVIRDGVEFMAEGGADFDVIIIDSTDPHGPGAVLFTESFYGDCKARLTERGILITQNGVPFLQGDEVRTTHRHFRALGFSDAGFYTVAVPTYVGGFMALGWASKDAGNRAHDAAEIRRRFEAAPFATRYYTPELHVASFALPRFIQDLLTEERERVRA